MTNEVNPYPEMISKDEWDDLCEMIRNAEWRVDKAKMHSGEAIGSHVMSDDTPSTWGDYIFTDKDMPRKSMLLPTDKQTERIKELKDRPEFSGEHLDWLIDAIQNRKMLNTRGQAEKLIFMMKQKIREAGGNV